MTADAKVYAMIEDLSRNALEELMENVGYANDDAELSLIRKKIAVRTGYEIGDIPAEEIIAAWNDDTWNGKEQT